MCNKNEVNMHTAWAFINQPIPCSVMQGWIQAMTFYFYGVLCKGEPKT